MLGCQNKCGEHDDVTEVNLCRNGNTPFREKKIELAKASLNVSLSKGQNRLKNT